VPEATVRRHRNDDEHEVRDDLRGGGGASSRASRVMFALSRCLSLSLSLSLSLPVLGTITIVGLSRGIFNAPRALAGAGAASAALRFARF